jgi:hypothetical protein
MRITNNISKLISAIVSLTICSSLAKSQISDLEKYISIIDTKNSEIKIIEKGNRITIFSDSCNIYDGILKEIDSVSIVVVKQNLVGDEKYRCSIKISDVAQIGYINVGSTLLNRALSNGMGNNRTYKMVDLKNGKYKIEIKNQIKKVYKTENRD